MEKLFRNLSTRQTIAKNAFWLLASQGISRVLRFAVIFIATRALGPDGYGSFSYALSAATLAFVFADWGVDMLVLREFNRVKDRMKFLRAALGLKAALVCAFGVIGALGYWLINEPVAQGVYLLMILLMMLIQARDFFIYVLRAEERMEREFAVIGIESVTTLAGGLALLWLWPSVMAMGVAYVLGVALSLLACAWAMRGRYPRPLLAWDSGIARWLLRNGWSLAIFGVLIALLFSTDLLVLGRFRDPVEVGYYSLATKIVTLTLVVPQVVLSALFPYLMRVAGSRRSREVGLAMTGILAAGGVATALLLQPLAPLVIRIVGGEGFELAIPILQHLIWLTAMLFPVTFLDYYLIAHGRQVADMAATAVAVIANAALNLYLVPKAGVSGAVAATLIGQGINFVLTLLIAAKVFIDGEKESEPEPVAIARPEETSHL